MPPASTPPNATPRVALVIDGIGLDRGISESLLTTLPAAVDIAFSAYAPPVTAAALAQTARQQGRECLVSIPMEPSGFPTIEEGDRSLMVGNIPAQNTQNLEWSISSVTGCIGATGGSDGMNGERFAQSHQAFNEILAALDHRGLIYLDSRPNTPPSGPSPPRDVDIVVDRRPAIDEPPTAQAIDQNLAALEHLASIHGAAIGLAGPPTPVLIDRIAVWTHTLAAKGLVLAPLSAIPAPTPPPETK